MSRRQKGPLPPCQNNSIFEPLPMGSTSTLSHEVPPWREGLGSGSGIWDMGGSERQKMHTAPQQQRVRQISQGKQMSPPCLFMYETTVVLHRVPHPRREASVDITLRKDTLPIGEPWSSKPGSLQGRRANMQQGVISSGSDHSVSSL